MVLQLQTAKINFVLLLEDVETEIVFVQNNCCVSFKLIAITNIFIIIILTYHRLIIR